ncbi:MAG TPA: FAD-dependent oxidoreductase [Casimicrobiaceae bacterium]|nr:FAD-dependent oxidoreductase [Casimicrobiaceae bacterium]
MPDRISRPAALRSAPAIAIVGAGVVGAAIAYALCRRGAHVTLIDRAEPGRGCSFGNAGALSPGSVAPLALPGLAKSLPRLLLDPDSPLHLPPAYLPRALPWLLRFVAASRPDRVEAIAERLAALNADAIEHHLDLAREVGAADLIRRTGHLHVYPDAGALAKDAYAWTLRARHGVRFERLDRAGIEALEPGLSPRYTVGIWLADHAVVVNPFRYVQQIVRGFVVRGGRLVRDQVRAIEPDLPRGWSVATAEGRQNVDHVIVAAGMHSAALLEPLGIRLPLESQRGYHVTFRGVAAPVSRVVVLADRKAFVTPMEQGFRIAGTVEFGGLTRPANPRRSALLARFAREAFTDVAGAEESHWMGHRPCTPESLALVGPVASRPGLWVATGHGHLGLTQSVNTARLLADAILEGAPVLTPAVA